MVANNSAEAPRDLHQVRQVKHKVRHQQCTQPGGANVADDVLSAIGMAETHPFVQKVFVTKGQAPTIALYTRDQIVDMKRFCCTDG